MLIELLYTSQILHALVLLVITEEVVRTLVIHLNADVHQDSLEIDVKLKVKKKIIFV